MWPNYAESAGAVPPLSGIDVLDAVLRGFRRRRSFVLAIDIDVVSIRDNVWIQLCGVPMFEVQARGHGGERSRGVISVPCDQTHRARCAAAVLVEGHMDKALAIYGVRPTAAGVRPGIIADQRPGGSIWIVCVIGYRIHVDMPLSGHSLRLRRAEFLRQLYALLLLVAAVDSAFAESFPRALVRSSMR